jgi:cell division protein FtsI (penicillin-binding protein 3)
VAGKTGTAQIALNASGYDKSSHKASFVGYFPADNPQYTCIVVVSAPAGNVYYGGLIAGPVFREIADKIYATNFELHPPFVAGGNGKLPLIKNGNRYDIKYVLDRLRISSHYLGDRSEGTYVRPSPAGNSFNLYDMDTVDGYMPNVEGMGVRDAVFLLENKGLKVIIEGYGTVVYQSFPPGTDIIKGNTVLLRLRT